MDRRNDVDTPEQMPSNSRRIGGIRYIIIVLKTNFERQAKFLLNTYSTILDIEVQSGASRQGHQQKARNTTTRMTNYVVKKITTSSTTS